MKSRTRFTLLALLAIAVGVTAAFSTHSPVKKEQKEKKDIVYYWFYPDKTFTGRINTVYDEFLATGYDVSMANPHTLQEIGFTEPCVATGANPPVPVCPIPSQQLYSHP